MDGFFSSFLFLFCPTPYLLFMSFSFFSLPSLFTLRSNTFARPAAPAVLWPRPRLPQFACPGHTFSNSPRQASPRPSPADDPPPPRRGSLATLTGSPSAMRSCHGCRPPEPPPPHPHPDGETRRSPPDPYRPGPHPASATPPPPPTPATRAAPRRGGASAAPAGPGAAWRGAPAGTSLGSRAVHSPRPRPLPRAGGGGRAARPFTPGRAPAPCHASRAARPRRTPAPRRDSPARGPRDSAGAHRRPPRARSRAPKDPLGEPGAQGHTPAPTSLRRSRRCRDRVDSAPGWTPAESDGLQEDHWQRAGERARGLR